jgi:hypothetical protein
MRMSGSNIQEAVKANILAAVPIIDVQIRRDLALVFRKEIHVVREAEVVTPNVGAPFLASLREVGESRVST